MITSVSAGKRVADLGDGPVRILLVEDVDDHAEYITTILTRIDKDIKITVGKNVEEGLALSSSSDFDLIISDYQIGPVDCFTFIKELQERGIDLPIIILTGQGNEEVAAQAIHRGAEDYLIKDTVFRDMPRLYRSILSAVQKHRLEEALRASEELYRTLVQNIHEGVFVLRGSTLEYVSESFAKILGSDVESLEGGDFFSFFEPDDRSTVIDFVAETLSSDKGLEGEFRMLGQGGQDKVCTALSISPCNYRSEPAIIGTVKDITKRKQAERKLREALEQKELLSITDELTGLFNRRHALAVLAKEIARCLRYSTPLSVIMLDVDLFKEINDQFGHLTGDDVLKHVSGILSAELRDSDTVSRYGGDEFIIILPGADINSARIIAERIRASAYNSKINEKAMADTKISLSLGLSQMQDKSDNITSLIHRADAALFSAKNAGRNVVAIEQ